MLKRFFPKGLIVSLLVLSGLALVLFVYGSTQQNEGDSTRPELKFVRAKIGWRDAKDLQYLKGMGIECPKSGECIVIITEAQRRQIEKAGLKAKALTGLRPDKGPNLVEYKIVREVDLKADGVETIVFGPKKDKSSALSELVLGLNGTDNEVCVYDSNFNLIHKMHLRDASFSRNLRYIGGIKFEKVPQDVTEMGSYKFELFDYTGKKLWELERELHYDASYNGYSISSNGTVVEGDWNGILTFYDQKGNERKKVQLYRGTGDIGGQGMTGQFSEDGEYLFEIAHDDVDHVFGVGKGVMLFTSNGEELWRFAIEENGGGGLGISNQGNYMIVSAFVWPVPDTGFKASTYLLSQTGKLIKRYDNLYTGRICFSSNEKYAFLAHQNTPFLTELNSGEVISQWWKPKMASQYDINFNSVDIAEDVKILGLISCYPGVEKLVQDKEGNVRVLMIGFDGSKVWSDIFPSEEGRSLSPVNLRLSDDGKQMIIQIGSKIMVYQQAE